METLGISKFMWASIVASLLIQVLIGVFIVIFFFMVSCLQLYKYIPYWVIRVLNRGCKIIVVVFIILFILNLYIMTELLFKKHELTDLPFYLPAELNELLPESIKFLKIAITKKGLVFYFLTLLLYPTSVYLLFMDKEKWLEWYWYLWGHVVISWVLFIVMFTDNFLIACSGHILICCILFFVIYFILWRYSQVRIPIIIWVVFFFWVIMIISGFCGLYWVTGSFLWSITQGVEINGVWRYLLQYCFIFGVLLPVGLFPAYHLTLDNYKALPISFVIFCNTVFLFHCFFMVTLIYNLFGGLAFNYFFFFIICMATTILTSYLYFEITFIRIISLVTTLHFHFFLGVYIEGAPVLQNGLVFYIWLQLACISGIIIILAKYANCYNNCITIFRNGVFYKYPGLVLVNMVFILFFIGYIGSFFYQVYWKFNCVADNIIVLNILNISAVSIVIVWVWMLWCWLDFWFKAVKGPDPHTPQRFNWLEVIVLVYLLLIVIVAVFYPWIFYW